MPYTFGERPNLLYIHSDQHNPFVTGCYGDPVVQTPHLDRLAAEGVVFENAYCPSPICVPSRMSTLTGRHPHENDCWTNQHSLDSGIPTLAHAMGAAGYWPVLIGRMHSRGPDQLHGYAERLVGDHSANYLGGTPGVDHGMLTGTQGPARISLKKSGIGQNAYQVHDEYVTAAAVHRLEELGIARRSGVLDEPFSISVGFMLPHQPFVARRQDYERYEGKVPPPDHPEPWGDHLHPYHRWWRERCGIAEVAGEWIMRARTAYWALVDRVDHMVGQILDALERNGLTENTLIIYSSDHGEQAGEHGLWWKQTFYDEAVSVPLIMHWPGHLPEGVRYDGVVSALDLNATILDALDAPSLPASHGRTLLPVLRGESEAWHDTAFSEYCTDEGCIHRMVRRGDWKLNYYHGQPPQLFNLREDPKELHDRADDPDCRAILDELTDVVLEGWDPDAVWARMQEKRADEEVLTAWAQCVKPPETYRWPLQPQMDYLEEE
ncbi:MAG: sulfatase-like hydrolase/transferase [Anaerolineales bacterium]